MVLYKEKVLNLNDFLSNISSIITHISLSKEKDSFSISTNFCLVHRHPK